MSGMRFVGVATVLAACATAGDALAYHAGADFTKEVFDGGAAGIFYLGTPKERGWTCTMCHVEAPGKLKMRFDSNPPELAREQRYVPGTRYEITVDMIADSELGVGNPQANYNALAMTIENAAGEPFPSLSGKATEFTTVNFSTLLPTGTDPRKTSWTVTWTTPAEPGKGNAYLFLAIVDGNGGGQTGTTFTDPFGDDVIMARFVLEESGAVEARSAPVRVPAEPSAEPAHLAAQAEVALIGLGLLVPGLVLGRRRSRKGLDNR